MQELAEFHLFILVVIGHVVITDQVGDAGDGNGRLELVGLGNQPIAKLAAVADALEAHSFAVEPEIAAHRGADRVENVLGFIPVLVAEDRVGKLLAIAGGAAIIYLQHRPAVRRRRS